MHIALVDPSSPRAGGGRGSRKWEQERADEDQVTPSRVGLAQLEKALRVPSAALVHEVFTSLFLSEAVYKHDEDSEDVSRALAMLQESLPPRLCHVRELQFTCDWASQRCVIAETRTTLFVCFRGTKVNRDLITDFNIFFEPLFKGKEANMGRHSVPSAHRGFLSRARAVPVVWFHRTALKKKKRLVFCGHSLGGAVATLATLRLLHLLSSAGEPTSRVHCVAFGSPPVANVKLRDMVDRHHWAPKILNYTLEEDYVPYALLKPGKLFSFANRGERAHSPARGEGVGEVLAGAGLSGRGRSEEAGEVKPAERGLRGGTAFRIKRLVPLLASSRAGLLRMRGGGGGAHKEGSKGSNMYTYLGQQLTVFEGFIAPASSKRRRGNEGSGGEKEDDPPPSPSSSSSSSSRSSSASLKEAEGGERSNWRFKLFESHRMYTYRERIVKACGLEVVAVPSQPLQAGRVGESPAAPVAVKSILPRVELTLGLARFCLPFRLEETGGKFKIGVHVVLVGSNITSCKSFHLDLMGKSRRLDLCQMSALDRPKVSRWASRRLPQHKRFWDAALVGCEEVLETSISVDATSLEQARAILEQPATVTCISDFHSESSVLAAIPSRVHVAGSHMDRTRLLHDLLEAVHNREIMGMIGKEGVAGGGGGGGEDLISYSFHAKGFLASQLTRLRTYWQGAPMLEDADVVLVLEDLRSDGWEASASRCMPSAGDGSGGTQTGPRAALLVLINASGGKTAGPLEEGRVRSTARQAGFDDVHVLTREVSELLLAAVPAASMLPLRRLFPAAAPQLSLVDLRREDAVVREMQVMIARIQELLFPSKEPSPHLHTQVMEPLAI